MTRSLLRATCAIVLLLSSITLAQDRSGEVAKTAAPPAAPGTTTPKGQPIPPLSAASAVLVVDSQAVGLPAELPEALDRRINTHVALLTSDALIRRAIAQPNSEIRKTAWFRQSDDPTERVAFIHGHLRARAIPHTSLIEVALDGITGNDRKTILTELCGTHIENQCKAAADTMLERTGMLNNIKIKVTMRLRDINAELHERQVKIGGDGGATMSGQIGVKEQELNMLVSEQIHMSMGCHQARTQLENATTAAQESKPLPQFDTYLRKDTRYCELQRMADDIELRLVVAKRHEDKSAIGDTEAQFKLARDKLDSRKAELRAQYMEDLHLQAKSAEQAAERLKMNVGNLKADLGKLTNATMQLAILQEEQRGLREQLKKLWEQIENSRICCPSSPFADIHWQQMPDADPIK